MQNVVDLRSDTVTRPTAAMRAVLAEAPVGDDVFGDDPSVVALEAAVARRLGKAAAVFVPSGTMANQLAILAHTRRGDAIITHAEAHIVAWEAAGPALLSGVMCRTVPSPDGVPPLELVRRAAYLGDDPHCAPTRLLCVENTHNASGGRVHAPATTVPLTRWAAEAGVRTHLDGARIWNAAAALGVAERELTEGFDTVSACFSKGLGAPVGSVVAGPVDVVREARRYRKLLGGGMRQAGILAAAALHAMDHHTARLVDDHRRARVFAETVNALGPARVDLDAVQTNLVYFELPADHALTEPHRGVAALVRALAERGVRITGSGTRYRAVFHLDVDDLGLERALEAFRAVLNP